MRFKREEEEWLFVRDSRIWNLPQDVKNTILPALRLSYTNLTPELRQCFAFCSLYPKDHKMKKEELVRLWMANDLIQSKEGMQLEDIGNEIFGELSWRSLFEEEKEEKFSYGYDVVVSYTMHGLLHDLACSININECSHMDDSNQTTNVAKDTRHLFLRVQTPALSIIRPLHQSGSSLRTLLVYSHNFHDNFLDDFSLSCFSSLRALSLNHEKSAGLGSIIRPKLINSIVHLKHLRYLNFSRSRIVLLPEYLCKLRNLQTLELEDCYDLKKLPKCTRDLCSLRHLNIKGCNLTEMPIELGKLTSLRMLSFFIVSLDYGRGIKELQGLDHLSGELEIKGLEHVHTLEDAKKATLMRKKHLTSLKLYWSDSDLEGGNPRDVIEGLQPHPNVKSLSIHGYRGLTFPSWLTASWLSNLVNISIADCTECEHLPSLGTLLLLKRIAMWGLESLKFIASDHFANEFPSLEYLTISSMPILEGWFPGNVQEIIQFPCLKELRISSCPKLKTLPPSLLSVLEYVELSHCNPMILASLKNIPRLSNVRISNFAQTTNFPKESLQNVPSLKSLFIWNCLALLSLPEVGSSSLTNLIIINCPSLTNVSQGLRCQTILQTLNISESPKAEISAIEYHHLKSLKSLEFRGVPNLTSFPDGLQHVSLTLGKLQIWQWSALMSVPDWLWTFTSLESLDFGQCENLRNLPDGIQHLTSLQSLGISRCKSLKNLPDGLQHLTNLQTLRISRCHPKLHGKCNKENGEYWPMIAHIPVLDNYFPEDD